MTFAYNPIRRALVVADARLTKLMQREPESCASISEYAARTGIETGQVMELLSAAVNDDIISFEIWAEEIFVHTAPQGRPTPEQVPEVAPNLWEWLRADNRSVEDAYLLWRLTRSLERAGWRVETNQHRIQFGLAKLHHLPPLGIQVANSLVPLLVHPSGEQLTHEAGPLSMFDHAGAASVGVICDSGALDAMVTATRRWGLQRRGRTGMSVIVFEAPRYAPTLLRPGDASVAPRSVSQQTLQSEGLSGTHAG